MAAGVFLPPIQTLSYNGHTFNGTTKSKVKVTNVKDRAGRVVVAQLVTIEAREILQDDDGTDAAVAIVQAQLMQPGKQFVFSDGGVGALSVNGLAALSMKDLQWGPMPIECTKANLGMGNAVEILWTVQMMLPCCQTASAGSTGKIMEFNYSVRTEVPEVGLMTRSITGYFTIPMTRMANGNAIPDCADAYKGDVLKIPPIIGWKRRQEYNLSSDKRTIDFTIVDSQPAGILAKGCVGMRGSHSMENASTAVTAQFNSSLSMQYTLGPGQPKMLAFLHFQTLCQDRIGWSKQQARSSSPPGDAVLTRFRAIEGLGEDANQVSFEAGWWYTSSRADCLINSGMFRPIPGDDPNLWSSSVAYIYADPYGPAGLTVPASADALVSLCDGPRSPVVPNSKSSSSSLMASTPLGSMPAPEEDSSWLYYKIELIIRMNPNTVRQKPLPTKPTKTTQGMGDTPISTRGSQSTGLLTNVSLNQINYGGTSSGKIVNEPAYPPDVIQQRTAPSWVAILRGVAIRVAYGIPLPRLVSIGGAKAIAKEPQWSTGNTPEADLWGIRVYKREWWLEYFLDQAPDNAAIPVIQNPALSDPS
jgi:hypothetical protein